MTHSCSEHVQMDRLIHKACTQCELISKSDKSFCHATNICLPKLVPCTVQDQKGKGKLL